MGSNTHFLEPEKSSPSLLILSPALCLLILFALHIFQSLKSPLNRIPGPFIARFSSVCLKLATINGQRMYYVHSMHRKYGPYVRISPNEVAISDPTAYKQIHGVASGYNKTPWYQAFAVTPRFGVFATLEAKPHAKRRKLLARPFSKTHLRQHWEGVVRERVDLAVSRIHTLAKQGSVDILLWWTFMTSDISTHLMFGKSFNTLEHGKVSDYIRTLTQTIIGSGISVELPLVRWIGSRLPFQACRNLFRATETLGVYANAAVENMKATQGTTNIFANMMAEAENGESLDDEDIKSEATNLIIAGTDTTSVTLTYLIWAILSRPELQQSIEKEVANLPEDFNEAALERLEMLNAIIEETLRLYGAAPGSLPRIVPPGGLIIEDNLELPAGTIVSTQAYTYHRDPELFPDPLIFIPARWLASKENNRYRVSDAAKAVFSPFGSGSRSCLGLHLAYMELRLGAAVFFRKCAGARLALTTTPASMEMVNHFLISPKSHKCEVVL